MDEPTKANREVAEKRGRTLSFHSTIFFPTSSKYSGRHKSNMDESFWVKQMEMDRTLFGPIKSLSAKANIIKNVNPAWMKIRYFLGKC